MNEYLINLPTFQLTQQDFFIRLLVTIGIGFLIGLEREHTAMTNNEKSFAGIRTFVFLVLLGFIAAMVYYLLAPWVYGAVFLAAVIFVGVSYWITASKGDIGGTTEFSALIAFLLGSLSFLGYIELSLAITVIVLVVLSSKLKLKSIIGKITQEELYDLIRFVVAALLIFPFLPDANMGPYEVINPREIGWVVILTSGLGLLGYLLIKFLGASKGILLTGILGGLVSSTLITWVFAKRSRETPAFSANYATGILAASTIMVIRVMLWVTIFNGALARSLYVPLGIMLLAAAGITLYFYLRHKDGKNQDASIPLGKPLNLQGALIFGLLYMAIIVLISYTHAYFGAGGILVSSSLAGLADVDAITISISKLAGTTVPLQIAGTAVLLATICNTLVKFSIALWAGSREIKKFVLIGYGVIFLAALVGLGLVIW
ncbi:MAG: MgtC/SapB family protein [Saprospiraceae bacterium]|nr:MgtC/SapB family protein [Saprospiraceae bacterium]MDZ4703924.1 MgtC/SapB family protein [Saprospiraceae bacterium]